MARQLTGKPAFLQQGQLAGIPVSQVMGIVREPEVPAKIATLQAAGRGAHSWPGPGVIHRHRRRSTRRGRSACATCLDVPRADWGQTTTGDVMTPLSELPRVGPNDQLLTAVQLMDANRAAAGTWCSTAASWQDCSPRDEVLAHTYGFRSEAGALRQHRMNVTVRYHGIIGDMLRRKTQKARDAGRRDGHRSPRRHHRR